MALQWKAAAPLQGVGEFFPRDACHFERTSQSTKGDLPMHRDDATALPLRRDFLEDDVAFRVDDRRRI